MSSKLLALAALGRTEIKIEGERLLVREPSALELMDYRKALKEDNGRVEGLTGLIHACVINEDGTPLFSKEEAVVIATGSNKVLMPLIDVLTDFSSADSKLKKAGAPSESSSSS